MWLGNLIGSILAYFLGTLTKTDAIIRGNRVKIYAVKRLIPKWAVGQTWGNIILMRGEYATNTKILTHEAIHVEQWEKYSIFFIPLYILFTIEAATRYGIKQGYRENRFEKEARLLSGH